MEELKIAICEDDQVEQVRLVSILNQSNISTTYTIFNSGEALLRSYRVDDYDLILMDIYMVGITGVEAVKKIRCLDKNIFIAFITSSKEHALESYDLHVYEYFLKPINAEKFLKFLDFVQSQKYNVPKLDIKINGKDVCLPFRDIIYIEQEAHIVCVYLQNGEVFRAKHSLDNLMEQFDNTVFFRCHASFIVNLKWVKKINHTRMVFEMKNGNFAYIRRNDVGKAQKAFHGYHIAQQILLG